MLEVSEGIAGTWFYHLSDGPNKAFSMCGARVMVTNVPLSAWGHVSHLKERWCKKCERHLPGRVEQGKGES